MSSVVIDFKQTGNAIAAKRIPVYVYATVLASVSIIIGLIWDISWHMSIGRDGLLSPPHLAIYFGGMLAGFFSGFQVLKTTFAGSKEEKNRSLKFWGVFYGSLGALFCIWGAFAMLTSAPFDDWWHNTYGLDVTILSPPHTVLLLGMITIQFGAMVSVLAFQNQNRQLAADNTGLRRQLVWLFGLSAGFVLVMIFTIGSEFMGRHDMHNSTFYQVASLLFPLLLVAASTSSLGRWGATFAATVYTLAMAVMVWILPLFEAEPLLGPVMNPIENFQAFEFPLLLVVPALLIDLITQRTQHMNTWARAAIYGAVFLVALLAVQWPFGDFLMSEYSRNWFFGTTSWYFGSSPDWEYRYAFAPWMEDTGLTLAKGLGIALVIGFLSARTGLAWGNWMKKVYR